jgi:ribonuclease HI
MELMAAIAGLRGLKLTCTVTVFSDSRYVVNPMQTGLVHKWKANDWMRNRKDKVLNVDLWEQLLALTTQFNASFDWLRGHHGHELNERCDRIAAGAANQPDLQADEVYESDHLQTLTEDPGVERDSILALPAPRQDTPEMGTRGA